MEIDLGRVFIVSRIQTTLCKFCRCLNTWTLYLGIAENQDGS